MLLSGQPSSELLHSFLAYLHIGQDIQQKSVWCRVQQELQEQEGDQHRLCTKCLQNASAAVSRSLVQWTAVPACTAEIAKPSTVKTSRSVIAAMRCIVPTTWISSNSAASVVNSSATIVLQTSIAVSIALSPCARTVSQVTIKQSVSLSSQTAITPMRHLPRLRKQLWWS